MTRSKPSPGFGSRRERECRSSRAGRSDLPRSRCVHLVPTTAQAGAETRARELIARVAERGEYAVEVVYFEPGAAHERFVAMGVPLRQLRPRMRFAFDFPRLGLMLRRMYRDGPPGILHTWLPHGNITGLIAARAWPETKLIVTQCGGRGEELFYRRQIQVQKALLGRADYAISNSTEGVIALEGWGMSDASVSLVLNGVSPARIAVERDPTRIRAELGVGAKAPLVAVATRANDRFAAQQKDIAGLLGAVGSVRSELDGTRLVLVGPTEQELAAAGLELPDWAVATGFAPQPSDYLNAADVVVISSVMEGMSNVACEALMLGRPVVTTRVGDHVAVVEAAGGRSVPVRDSAALAAAIAEMIRAAPDPAQVRAVAEGSLSLDRMVDATSAIYRKLFAYQS